MYTIKKILYSLMLISGMKMHFTYKRMLSLQVRTVIVSLTLRISYTLDHRVCGEIRWKRVSTKILQCRYIPIEFQKNSPFISHYKIFCAQTIHQLYGDIKDKPFQINMCMTKSMIQVIWQFGGNFNSNVMKCALHKNDAHCNAQVLKALVIKITIII